MKDKNFTGIPKELQPWEGFTRDSQTLRVSVDKRRYGKNVTNHLRFYIKFNICVTIVKINDLADILWNYHKIPHVCLHVTIGSNEVEMRPSLVMVHLPQERPPCP